jgi:hemerythrin
MDQTIIHPPPAGFQAAPGFRWEDTLAASNPILEFQVRVLLRFIDRFNQCSHRTMIQNDVEVLREINARLVSLFWVEEKILTFIECDQRAAHRKEHISIIFRFSSEMLIPTRQLYSNTPRPSIDWLPFLLNDHMQIWDKAANDYTIRWMTKQNITQTDFEVVYREWASHQR